MRNLAISFSARKGGNCERLAKYLTQSNGNAVCFFDLKIHNCSECAYECFSSGGCKYEDGIFDLYNSFINYDKIFFVVPIYCSNPSSLYYIFSERSQAYFTKYPLFYEEFIRKLYVIGIYGDEETSSGFLEVFEKWFTHTEYKSHVLGLERHRYNLKLNDYVLDVPELKDKVDKFASQKLQPLYSELQLRRPTIYDVDEIESFKNSFNINNFLMSGSGPLISLSAEEWINFNEECEMGKLKNCVPSLQMGLFNKKTGKLMGLIQLRSCLSEDIIEPGGNISYCVRPDERGNGYAKYMLKNILQYCKPIGINKILLTCDDADIASVKTIESCGGIYERTILNGDKRIKRFWINIK